MGSMAVAPKKLSVGDLVEVEGRRYDVVPDKVGGVTLEPAITQTVDDIHAELGGRRATPEEFDELFGHLPSDGEG
jgi:hypothetical protein